VVALALGVAVLATTAGDWPMYLHEPGRSSATRDETILSPANAAGLVKRWSFQTGGPVEASATVVSGTVYIGSWDGYEYALDAATGALKWKTFLGTTTSALCNPTEAGISSTAAVQNGIVYVGGGDSFWYALNAATGAPLWRVFTGAAAPYGGYHNWSSPLIFYGYAIIGVASFGDCPLVQGQLLAVNLQTHQLVGRFNIVPAGQVGGGVWSSSALDPATGILYVTTGNPGTTAAAQPLTQAMVAITASTLTLKGAWQIPPAQDFGDSDFGATPTLFDDGLGHHLVGAQNKNGIFYAFDRTNVGAGPVWQLQIGYSHDCPQCGAGGIAPAVSAVGVLYVASGYTLAQGNAVPGAVRALNPATGALLWEHAAPGSILAGMAYANGLIVDGAGNTMEVLNAATGALLYSYTTGNAIYAAPSISNGQIFEASSDGMVYAFGLPAGATSR
jgi:polyvinyl alcohol dehydrogenase (cytochrome)